MKLKDPSRSNFLLNRSALYNISIDHHHLQVSRTVEDFDEEEVTKAFQGECQTLGEL